MGVFRSRVLGLLLLVLTLIYFPMHAFAEREPFGNMLNMKKKCDPSMILYVLSVKSKGGRSEIDERLIADAYEIACALDIASKHFAKRNAKLGEKFAKALIMGIAHQESTFQRKAVSNKDAVGIMQVHWPTWKSVLEPVGIKRENLYNPFINAMVGVYVLEDCLNKHKGDVTRALGCYYGKYEKSYISSVLQNSKKFVLMQIAYEKVSKKDKKN